MAALLRDDGGRRRGFGKGSRSVCRSDCSSPGAAFWGSPSLYQSMTDLGSSDLMRRWRMGKRWIVAVAPDRSSGADTRSRRLDHLKFCEEQSAQVRRGAEGAVSSTGARGSRPWLRGRRSTSSTRAKDARLSTEDLHTLSSPSMPASPRDHPLENFVRVHGKARPSFPRSPALPRPHAHTRARYLSATGRPPRQGRFGPGLSCVHSHAADTAVRALGRPAGLAHTTPLCSHSGALNFTNGETVAVKQIQLTNIPKAELADIMVSKPRVSDRGSA